MLAFTGCRELLDQPRAEDRPRVGCAPSQWGRGADREVLRHCGPGVFVADPCLPSGDAPGDVVEYCTTAVRVSATHHDEASGAQCEDTASKSPQGSLISRFRPLRCRFWQ